MLFLHCWPEFQSAAEAANRSTWANLGRDVQLLFPKGEPLMGNT